jgi:8-oxo-dGTP diphosphatase
MPWDPRVHLGVGVCLVNSIGRLLMIERQGAHGAGQWSIVGGWVDYPETPEEAVIREMKEEVGIDVIRPKLIGVTTHIFDSPVDSSTTLFYKVPYTFDTMHTKIKEPDKISKIAWVDFNSIPLLDLFPPFEKFIQQGFRW